MPPAQSLLKYISVNNNSVKLHIPVGEDWKTSGKGKWVDVKTPEQLVAVTSIDFEMSTTDEYGDFDDEILVSYGYNTWDTDEHGFISDSLFRHELVTFLTKFNIPVGILNLIEYAPWERQDSQFVAFELHGFDEYLLHTYVIGDTNTINQRKKQIMSYILRSIKNNQLNLAKRLCNTLRANNINWPDLDIIEPALTPDNLAEAMKLSDLNTASEKRQLTAVKKDGLAIQFIKNPSEAVQLAAVQQDITAIRLIENPSTAVQMAAVQKNSYSLSLIKNPSSAVQIAAVQQNGMAIVAIKNPSEAVQLAAVQRNGEAIRLIKNPSLAVQLAAVQQNGGAIQWIKNPSETVQLAAVQKTSWAIRSIKNPSPAVQLAAVQKDGMALDYIADPSPELFNDTQAKRSIIKTMLDHMKTNVNSKVALRLVKILRKNNVEWPDIDVIEQALDAGKVTETRYTSLRKHAMTRKLRENKVTSANLSTASEAEQLRWVKNDGSAIAWIENPSEAVQWAAVQQDGGAIRTIKNPSPAMQLAAVQNYGGAIEWIENPSEAVQLAAVQERPLAIQYIKNPSEAVQLAAVQKTGYAIQYIKNPSPAVQMSAVQRWGRAIEHIKNPSPALQWAAVQSDGGAIKWIKNPSPAMQLAAVQQNGLAITYIENPTEAMQLAAVQQDGRAIEYIENPSPAVQMAAVQQNRLAFFYIKNPISELVADRNVKHSVIKWILNLISDNDFILAARMFKKLKNNGIQWPQLNVIEPTLSGNVNHLGYINVNHLDNNDNDDDELDDDDDDFDDDDLNETAKRRHAMTRKLRENIAYASEAEQIAAVTEAGYKIQFIKNPSLAVQLAAVKKYGDTIRYIKNPSEAVQLAALQKDSDAIRYIKNPSEAVQIAAAKQWWSNIRYIKNPSPAVQWAAVQNWASAIRYIKNPSEAMQMAAVQQDGIAIKWIKNPSPAVQWAAIKDHGLAIKFIKNLSPELVADSQIKKSVIKLILSLIEDNKLATANDIVTNLKKQGVQWPQLDVFDPALDGSVNHHGHEDDDDDDDDDFDDDDFDDDDDDDDDFDDDDLNETAKRRHAMTRKLRETTLLDNANESAIISAVKNNPALIRNIPNPSPAVQLAAVQRLGHAIRWIKNPSLKVQRAAIKRNGTAIQYIENPDENMQIAAIASDGDAILYIDNPSLFTNTLVKRSIIKKILNYLATTRIDAGEIGVHIDDAAKIVNYLNKHNVNWRELDLIEPALKKEIEKQSDDDLNETAKQRHAMTRKLRESISERPSINFKIERELKKHDPAMQTRILDALEAVKDAGTEGISVKEWADRIRMLHPDEEHPVADLLRAVVGKFGYCIQRLGDKRYGWVENDNEAGAAVPQGVQDAMGDQVHLTSIALKAMRKLGEFNVVELASDIARESGMPISSAVAFAQHIIKQFIGGTLATIGNDRYKVKRDEKKTASDHVAGLKDLLRKSGLKPDDR